MQLKLRITCVEPGLGDYDEYNPSVRLFSFEPVDVLRNQALHDSTLGLQNLEDQSKTINLLPRSFLTAIMNLLINLIKVYSDYYKERI